MVRYVGHKPGSDGMFRYEILAMFENGNAVYNDFTKALLSHRMEDLNVFSGILHTLP